MRKIYISCRLAVLLLCSMLSACAGGFGSHSVKSVEGLWSGRMITPSELTRKISVDLYPQDEQLKGQFRCAFGSTTCINNLSNGIVSGTLDASSFQVRLPDTTRCRFSGRFDRDRAGGEYSCYVGANLIEHGDWELNREDALKDQF